MAEENSIVLRISLALARFLVGAVVGLLVGLVVIRAPGGTGELVALAVTMVAFGLGGVFLGDRFLARFSRPMDQW